MNNEKPKPKFRTRTLTIRKRGYIRIMWCFTYELCNNYPFLDSNIICLLISLTPGSSHLLFILCTTPTSNTTNTHHLLALKYLLNSSYAAPKSCVNCLLGNQKLIPHNGHKHIQEEREVGGLVFVSEIAKPYHMHN